MVPSLQFTTIHPFLETPQKVLDGHITNDLDGEFIAIPLLTHCEVKKGVPFHCRW
jgi:hypothetical protein